MPSDNVAGYLLGGFRQQEREKRHCSEDLQLGACCTVQIVEGRRLLIVHMLKYCRFDALSRVPILSCSNWQISRLAQVCQCQQVARVDRVIGDLLHKKRAAILESCEDRIA